MANVVLFHHACGLTAGVEAFADRLRAAGHRLTVPDLYHGAVFDNVEDGVAHAEQIGLSEIAESGVAAARELSDDRQPLVAAGFSLGVLPAQKLAQTADGVAAVVLYHGGVPLSVFGGVWPEGVALQVHISPQDPFADAEDVVAMADDVPGAELHRYPGSAHLVTDSSLGEYDPELTDRIVERTLRFLSDL